MGVRCFGIRGRTWRNWQTASRSTIVAVASDRFALPLIREETAVHPKTIRGAVQSGMEPETPPTIAASPHRERPLVVAAESRGQLDHLRIRGVDREHRSTLLVVNDHVVTPSEAGMERVAADA